VMTERKILEWKNGPLEYAADITEEVGAPVLECLSSEAIKAELQQRGLWEKVEQGMRDHRSVMLADVKTKGVDFFAWIETTEEGEYVWVSIPSEKEGANAFSRLREWLFSQLEWSDPRMMPAEMGGNK
jgi:hypothetical protein